MVTARSDKQQVMIDLPPFFEWQKEVRDAVKKYQRVVVAASRQIGKTTCAVPICMEYAMRGGKVWWIAPVHNLSEAAWEELDRFRDQINDAYGKQLIQRDKQKYKFTFPGGGYVQFKSGEDHKTTRSKPLDFVVFDEAAYMSRDIWDAVSPALSTTNGKALFVSSPYGKNYFWELYRLGQSDDYPDWWSNSYTYEASPLASLEFIESERRTKPDRVFRREYLAQFVDAGGEVFSNVKACATLPVKPFYEPEEKATYVMGVDWGSLQDFTAIVVMDVNKKEQAAIYRLSGADFDNQYKFISEVSKRFGIKLCVSESNNIGLVNSSMLSKEGVPVVAFNTNQVSKRPLIEAWAVSLERQEVRMFNDEQMIKEHEAYESDVTPGGTIRYYAPHKGHDDYVIASALAWHGVQEYEKKPARVVFMPHSGLYTSSNPRGETRRNYSDMYDFFR